jgi:spore photoproduct lyase
MQSSTTSPALLRDRKTRFVELFRTTPTHTVCPNFYVLAHANGCAFQPQCNYCYLKSSFWYLKEQRVYANTEKLLEEVREWIGREGLETYMLNAGNLSDSLVFEGVRPLIGSLVELFRREAERKGRRHTLLLVTKTGLDAARRLAEQAPSARVIVSFSLNSPQAARIYERGAPPVEERLEAARLLRSRGWRVRIRIDPMIRGFDYAWLGARVRELRPERLTLGCLRAERSLLRIGEGEVFDGLIPVQEERALARYPVPTRLRLYRQAAPGLPPGTSLGLCEETPEIWTAVGLDARNPSCNCGA